MEEIRENEIDDAYSFNLFQEKLIQLQRKFFQIFYAQSLALKKEGILFSLLQREYSDNDKKDKKFRLGNYKKMNIEE